LVVSDHEGVKELLRGFGMEKQIALTIQDDLGHPDSFPFPAISGMNDIFHLQGIQKGVNIFWETPGLLIFCLTMSIDQERSTAPASFDIVVIPIRLACDNHGTADIQYQINFSRQVPGYILRDIYREMA
jgi:hypothetical protein